MRPHRRQPTRLPHPWDSPGKNIGVDCHFILQCMKVKGESEVTQSCPTPSDPMDCSPPGPSVHGIFQARVLEWGAIAFSVSLSSESNLATAWWFLLSHSCPKLIPGPSIWTQDQVAKDLKVVFNMILLFPVSLTKFSVHMGICTHTHTHTHTVFCRFLHCTKTS